MLKPQRRISIIYRFLPHYRVEFFERLRESLAADGIGVDLAYGVSNDDAEPPRRLKWALAVQNTVIRCGRVSFVWQHLPRSLGSADLVVLMQESRILSNYPILARGIAGKARVAFWGHGIDFQRSQASVTNRFKRFYSRQVDWWFAYTDSVARIVQASGFPADRITTVENAIDTTALTSEAGRIGWDRAASIRAELGLGPGPVGVYCGRLYDRKRIPFLLDAIERVRSMVPTFEMIIIGDGPLAEAVKRAADNFEWIHFVGPRIGLDRVPFFLAADAFLCPGAVGLAILDAFALQTPIVTTSVTDHGPEIDYLIPEQNGIMTDNSIESFVEGAMRVLSSAQLRDRLKAGCRTGAQRYTVENMVHNFTSGVHEALGDSL